MLQSINEDTLVTYASLDNIIDSCSDRLHDIQKKSLKLLMLGFDYNDVSNMLKLNLNKPFFSNIYRIIFDEYCIIREDYYIIISNKKKLDFKYCSKCNRNKIANKDNFTKNPRGKSSLYSICQVCRVNSYILSKLSGQKTDFTEKKCI